MPFRSMVAAEKAAIEGVGQEFDTQQCLALQNDLLSSSPTSNTNATGQIASTINYLITSDPPHKASDDFEVENGNDNPQHAESEILKSAEPVNRAFESTSELPPATRDGEAIDAQRSVRSKVVKRDTNNNLRFFDEEGNKHRDPDFERQQQAVREAMALEMGDLTQKSSMSLTQENPPSAYDQFDIQKLIRNDCPSTATPDDDQHARETLRTQHDSLHSKQHTSTRTESTAHTYEENDPRYIKLNFDPAPVDADADDEDENVSEDASFAAPRIEQQNAYSYEPQTPAPPLNPFNRKGSVMKASQMFGATQPSSIGRHLTSPTSSRPSPDIYNDFSSPPKRQRLASSPLAARAEVDDTSPLQSSVRHILARSMSTELPSATVPRTSGVQSFDEGPRIQRAGIHEPRPYLSMKESQERRRNGLPTDPDTDSDGSDSSIEARPRRKMEREQRIRQELSTIGRIPSSSSRPGSASAVIEVPSTVRRRSLPEDYTAQNESRLATQEDTAVEIPSSDRRRSWQEDYLAQCEGFDARDTQQDDVVADSQGNPETNEPLELPQIYASSNGTKPGTQLPQEQTLCHEQNVSTAPPSASAPPIDQQSGHQNELQEAFNTSQAKMTTLVEPSLPLQELSSNRSNQRTPMASKNQLFSDGSETVPETSPLPPPPPSEERLRPMGEIANISFGRDVNDDMADVPGFTQDIEFENAMRMRSSPQPPPRVIATRNDPAPDAEAVIPIPNEITVEHQNMSSTKSESSDLISPINPGQSAEAPSNVLDSASNIQRASSNRAEQLVADELHAEQYSVHGDHYTSIGNTKKSKSNKNVEDAFENDDQSTEPPSTKRTGLRSKSELKGPSRALRRSGSTSQKSTPVPPTRAPKQAGLRSAKHLLGPSTTLSTPENPNLTEHANGSSATRSSRQKPTATAFKESTPAPILAKRVLKRKSAVTVIDDDDSAVETRSSKRQSGANTTKEYSEDPLALPTPSIAQFTGTKPLGTLFVKMAFAVSYVKSEQERDTVTRLILDNGGQVLQDGFEILFDASQCQESDAGLSLSATAKLLGFSALIADEHSRKAKFMQALALGLPCISGHWVSACAAKRKILDWSPYLLCAGQSSFLGNAIKSRTLQPYSAIDATLKTTIESRDKLLNGKSVLVVMGRGKMEDKRKAYLFLTRALGPGRVGQVVDLSEAKKTLTTSESEGKTWDLLYVDGSEHAAAATVFGSATNSNSGSRKRKRGPTATEHSTTPPPKKIRVINDETMIQSLILGQLLDE